MRALRLAAVLVLACCAAACVETMREHRQARFTFESQPPGAQIEVLDAAGTTIASGPAPLKVVREFDAEGQSFDDRCWIATWAGGGSTLLGGVLFLVGMGNISDHSNVDSGSFLASGLVIGLGGLALTVLSAPTCAMLASNEYPEKLTGADPIRVLASREDGMAVEKTFDVAPGGVHTYRLILPAIGDSVDPAAAPVVTQPPGCTSVCTGFVAGAAAAGVDEAGRGALIRKCFQACGGDPVFTACLWDNVGDAYTPCAGLLK